MSNNDLISRSDLRKDIEHLHSVYAENKEWFYTDVLDHIDNAPTVITNCDNCPFKKFSEDLADKLAKVMVDNGITDFDEFAKQCGVSYLHQDSITKSDTQK